MRGCAEAPAFQLCLQVPSLSSEGRCSRTGGMELRWGWRAWHFCAWPQKGAQGRAAEGQHKKWDIYDQIGPKHLSITLPYHRRQRTFFDRCYINLIHMYNILKKVVANFLDALIYFFGIYIYIKGYSINLFQSCARNNFGSGWLEHFTQAKSPRVSPQLGGNRSRAAAMHPGKLRAQT